MVLPREDSRHVDASEVERAFQRGIRGAAYRQEAWAGEEERAAPAGPNEALLLKLTRLPGLREPRAAHETGRALRMIIRLFDQAGAPAIVGRQFIDNLGAAVLSEHMRGGNFAWGAADTADMFVEMYERILGGSPAEHDRVRRVVIDYAVAEKTAPAGPGGLSALFRRRRQAVASG
jgi:hypothetical protein